jgi:hypothetical protein
MKSAAEILRKYSDIISEQPAVTSLVSTNTNTATPGTPPTQTPPQSGQPVGGLNPQQAAMAAKQQQDQKKALQDQIKQAEQQLQNLRKQLAELG